MLRIWVSDLSPRYSSILHYYIFSVVSCWEQRNVLERFDLWMLFKNFLRDFLLLLWIPFMFPLALGNPCVHLVW
ncbi:unnamed protein product [Cuscuta campestris]|nr:unnamed protein product [Cuscuta campestris]